MKKTRLTKLQKEIAIALWHCKPIVKMDGVRDYEIWLDIRANIEHVLFPRTAYPLDFRKLSLLGPSGEE